MTSSDIIRHRLVNQQIAETKFKTPQEIVGWLGAMQAQEYAHAKWAIGLRLPGFKDTDIEKIFNDGGILRTHLMRPTWHFVMPADIRWILALTAPRVNAFNAFMYRKMELDSTVFNRSNDVLTKTLEGGKHLTRTALSTALAQAGIVADGVRLSCLMMRAELDAVVCSGPRQGKQFTYALLEERVPPTKVLSQDEALATLALRYFTSRGPATIRDFVWWSGLTMKEAKTGIAMLDSRFVSESIEGQQYFFLPNALRSMDKLQTSFLMPDYDEYGISYKDRSAIFIPKEQRPVAAISYHMFIIDGLITGSWQRSIKKNNTVVEVVPFFPLNKSQQEKLTNAIARYTSFVGNTPEE